MAACIKSKLKPHFSVFPRHKAALNKGNGPGRALRNKIHDQIGAPQCCDLCFVVAY
jgi:hypothetical protein